mgnify:CR=1 FL=1|jgi:hypothetical protein
MYFELFILMSGVGDFHVGEWFILIYHQEFGYFQILLENLVISDS